MDILVQFLVDCYVSLLKYMSNFGKSLDKQAFSMYEDLDVFLDYYNHDFEKVPEV